MIIASSLLITDPLSTLCLSAIFSSLARQTGERLLPVLSVFPVYCSCACDSRCQHSQFLLNNSKCMSSPLKLLSVCSFSQCLSNTRRPYGTQDVDFQRGIPQKDITGHGYRQQMFAVKVPCAFLPILWFRQLLWLGISACQHQAWETKKFHYSSSPVCSDREEEITIPCCREARKEGELWVRTGKKRKLSLFKSSYKLSRQLTHLF